VKKVLLVVAAPFVMSVPLFAQGVAAKWTGEAQARGGTQPVTLDIKADGGKLTGTLMQGQNTSEIADGKVDGSKITFTTTQNFGGNSVEIMWSGEVKGDELTLTRTGGGGGGGRGGGGGGGGAGRGAQPITLKRSK
jgi:hypothetical protein